MKQLPTLAVITVSIGLLAGCAATPDDAPDASDESQQITPQTAPTDDFQPLAVNMVAQSGTWFPDGVQGVGFGCSDTLVTIHTVPTRAETAEEQVSAAISFLLDDSQYYHGSPAVTNSLTLSETLELETVDVGRNAVDVALTGDVVVQGECEAYRIQAQLYGTAAATAGIEQVSVTINEVEVNDLLGLPPFDTSQVLTAAE